MGYNERKSWTIMRKRTILTKGIGRMLVSSSGCTSVLWSTLVVGIVFVHHGVHDVANDHRLDVVE